MVPVSEAMRPMPDMEGKATLMASSLKEKARADKNSRGSDALLRAERIANRQNLMDELDEDEDEEGKQAEVATERLPRPCTFKCRPVTMTIATINKAATAPGRKAA